MKIFQKIIFYLCLAAVLTTLCACGRYSDPSPIEGSDFPHTYPRN